MFLKINNFDLIIIITTTISYSDGNFNPATICCLSFVFIANWLEFFTYIPPRWKVIYNLCEFYRYCRHARISPINPGNEMNAHRETILKIGFNCINYLNEYGREATVSCALAECKAIYYLSHNDYDEPRSHIDSVVLARNLCHHGMAVCGREEGGP